MERVLDFGFFTGGKGGNGGGFWIRGFVKSGISWDGARKIFLQEVREET
jgi:hypothetical protein